MCLFICRSAFSFTLLFGKKVKARCLVVNKIKYKHSLFAVATRTRAKDITDDCPTICIKGEGIHFQATQLKGFHAC